MTKKTGERKAHILQTLAQMLEQPRAARITTAALAARMQMSEAALYRHFASKAQMFETLIEFIESSIFTLVNEITQNEPSGRIQTQRIAAMLLVFAERNRGMTRVLTGDAIVTEDPRLQTRLNHIDERIEASFRQSLRNGVADGSLPEQTQVITCASLLTHFVLGRWLRYARSGWSITPTKHIEEQLAIVLNGCSLLAEPTPS